MGEVWTPRALPLHDGRLSLTEALGESGGPNPWTADASQIYVVRKLPVELGGEDALPEIYHLDASRSEEHTSELQSLMRISYAVFCLKKNTKSYRTYTINRQT